MSAEERGLSPSGGPWPQRQIRIASIVALLAAAWLLSPLLTAQHLECFSQRLLTIGISDLRGSPAHDDAIYPMLTEYLYTTRLGAVHLLEGLMRLTGNTADVNFRLLTIASLAVMVASCSVFARRWAGQPAWASAAAVLLTPGVVESGFYFADNLPSAALAVCALALVGRQTPVWRWALIGGVFAGAVLTRLDAVYVTPMFPALFLLGARRGWRETLAAGAAFCAGAGLLFLLSQWLTGVSLLLSLKVGAMWSARHVGYVTQYDTNQVVLAFFGLALPVLLLLGVRDALRRRSVIWNAVLLLLPVLFYMVVIPKSLQTRVFLLLGAPFLALHGAVGLRLLIDALRASNRNARFAARAAVGVFVVAYLVPPFMIVRDGPRALLGRIWSPLLWTEWQERQQAGESRIRTLVDGIPAGQRVFVMSATWQADSAFHLVLLQRGWRKLPPSSAMARDAGPCERAVEVYADGDRRLLQYRMEDPFDISQQPPLGLTRNFVQTHQFALAARCVAGKDFDAGYLADWDGGKAAMPFLRIAATSAQTPTSPYPARFPLPVHKQRPMRQLQLIAVTPADLAGLEADATAVMAQEVASGRSRRLLSEDALRKNFSAVYWRPRPAPELQP